MTTADKIDSRICVKRSENGFSINRQDISIPDSIEILARLIMYIRARDFGVFMGKDGSTIDSFTIYPSADESEISKICIAFDYETHLIQTVITGLNQWDACVLLEAARSYLNALSLGMITE